MHLYIDEKDNMYEQSQEYYIASLKTHILH